MTEITLHTWQEEIIESEAQFRLLISGRRVGKTEVCLRAVKNENGHALWLTVNYEMLRNAGLRAIHNEMFAAFKTIDDSVLSEKLMGIVLGEIADPVYERQQALIETHEKRIAELEEHLQLAKSGFEMTAATIAAAAPIVDAQMARIAELEDVLRDIQDSLATIDLPAREAITLLRLATIDRTITDILPSAPDPPS